MDRLEIFFSWFVLTLIGVATIYGAFAFIWFDIYPSTWGAMGRTCVVLGAMIWGVATTVLALRHFE